MNPLITTSRIITDGKLKLVETQIVAGEPPEEFMQFCCKIRAPVQAAGIQGAAEGKFEFNAATYEEAFAFAHEHYPEEEARIVRQAKSEAMTSILKAPAPPNLKLNNGRGPRLSGG